MRDIKKEICNRNSLKMESGEYWRSSYNVRHCALFRGNEGPNTFMSMAIQVCNLCRIQKKLRKRTCSTAFHIQMCASYNLVVCSTLPWFGYYTTQPLCGIHNAKVTSPRSVVHFHIAYL